MSSFLELSQQKKLAAWGNEPKAEVLAKKLAQFSAFLFSITNA
jgi:hypothetical protein